MTARDAYAYIEKTIDNVEDLDDDLAWTNAEVLEMLVETLQLFGGVPEEGAGIHRNRRTPA